MTAIQLELAEPSPQQVKAARKNSGLSQAAAADLLGLQVQEATASRGRQSRGWQGYESESEAGSSRRMSPQMWALFLLLTGQHREFEIIRRSTN